MISVFSGELSDRTLEIDLWLMSCRVLKRGMENFLFHHVVEAARRMGATQIRGTYIPSAKNGLVADLYPSLGFSECGRLEEGTTLWSLSVDRFEPAEVQITEVECF